MGQFTEKEHFGTIKPVNNTLHMAEKIKKRMKEHPGEIINEVRASSHLKPDPLETSELNDEDSVLKEGSKETV